MVAASAWDEAVGGAEAVCGPETAGGWKEVLGLEAGSG